MAGTIVADIIQSDQSYASSINIASPMVVSNTLTMGAAAAISGNVNFDSATLFVDSVGNKVGIGTTTPAARLHLEGTGNELPSRAIRLAYDGTYYADIVQEGAGGLSYRTYGGLSHKWSQSGTTVMSIDGSGRVTKPYQPAFFAQRTAGSYNSEATIVWNDVSTNIGSCYNTSTGRFTAPIAGTYHLGFSGIGGQLSGTAPWQGIVYIRKNGSSIKYSHWNTTSNWDNISGEVILTLAANDYIDFYVGGLSSSASGFYGASLYSSAYGYLIG